ncbi:MAG: hypothetical protein M0Z75_08575 [Nitrospiraceae bacterium]|nr:hypothetical protein [Nitrospiraceae bacterium]
MRCLVLDSFKARTDTGEMEIKPGQIVSLPKEAAIRLLNESKVEPIQRTAIKVYSRILDACLWVVQDEADREALQASEGISSAVYTVDEVHRLYEKKAGPTILRRVHEVKQLFPGSIIREVKKETA